MKIIKDNDGNEFAEINVRNIGENKLAVRFDDGDNKFWIPIFYLEDWPDKGEAGTALVHLWFAEKGGLV